MNIRLDIYHHITFDVAQLSRIESSLQSLLGKVNTMSQAVDDLVQAVADQKGDINSMKVFIAGLEQQIKDVLSGVTLPPAVEAKLQAVFADVKSNSQEIKDAIDNDPATPAPPPGP